MTGQNFLLPSLGLFCLIGINAFFTAAEFSIVSVRRSRISQLVENGDIQAQTVQSFQRGIDRLLSTTQLGITLSSLALGWIGEPTIAVLIAQLIKSLPLPPAIINGLAHSFAIPIAFVCLVYLQIVLGELVPKSLALLYPEKLARFFAPPSLVISQIFRPFLSILNLSTRLLLKSIGIKDQKQAWNEQLSAQELQLIINAEKESTDLEESQREILNNVLELGDVNAIKVMTPRTKIKFLNKDATFAQLLEKINNDKYFRYPVIGESLDEIIGVIDYKSLVIPLAAELIHNESVITPWVKSVRIVPENASLKELLSLMQREKQEMVIVVDEFSGTSGLITIQDLISEIIGDQNEPESEETNIWQQINETTYVVSAQMSLEDVNRHLAIDLPVGEDYNTLSGFLQEQWQKIPIQGEIFDYNDLQFTIISTEKNRLHQIKIQQQPTGIQPSNRNQIVSDES